MLAACWLRVDCVVCGGSQQIINQSATVGSVMYNDEPPNGPASSSGGHCKGVLATTVVGGFWLVHSVPLFPSFPADAIVWNASTIYGQSFLCSSVNATAADGIAKQVLCREWEYIHSMIMHIKYQPPPLFPFNDPHTY